MAQTNLEDSSSIGRQFIHVVDDQEPIGGHKPPIGYLTAFMHLVKGYVGTGIFAMGQAFKNSGIVLGPVLLAVIAVMNLDCQHMIVKASVKIAEAEEQDVKPSLAETVEYTIEMSENKWLRSHSRRLGIITNLFLCFTELGFCCVYFVFIADHILEITSHYGFLKANDIISTHIMLAIILVPMWLSTFLGSLKLLLPLSVFANILMWAGIIMVFYFTLEGKPSDDKPNYVASVRTIPMFFGTALFSFEGITFVIPLRNEMKHPHHFVMPFGVLNVGMIFVCALFTAVGVLAYWKYGEDVASSVFLNLPEDDALSLVIKGLIAVSVLFTFTLHMYIPCEIIYPLIYRKYGPFKHKMLMKIIFKSFNVLLTFTLANVVPLLGLFISLVGASSGAFLALILPPIIDFISSKEKLKWFHIVKNIIIMGFGIIGAIFGTGLSLYDIVIEIKARHSNRTAH